MTDDELLEAARLMEMWWERGTFATSHVCELANTLRAHVTGAEVEDIHSALDYVPQALLDRAQALAMEGPTEEIRNLAKAWLAEVAEDQGIDYDG